VHDTPRDALVALLKLAYSGEFAARGAYRGHARSVRDHEERAAIARIEDEEWHGRRLVGDMLRERFARDLETHVPSGAGTPPAPAMA
jgi:demethoxyubiquinone hydroxylase (CLK1/Coq7/Cat5 family)